MAVQARQQFLYSNNNSNGDGTAMGWVDGRGGLPVDLCRRPLQQPRQMAATAACSSALAMEQPSSGLAGESFPCSLVSQLESERREMDQFLCLQRERLRVALQQQMRHHLVSLMRTLESKASVLLRRKEEELARASKAAAELEERLRRSEAESQAWQRVARESEAMALALSSALEQARDTGAGLPPASPAASCCNSSSDQPPAARRCRGCGVGDSRVLFLPCMHLCACELCEALLGACPVCRCVKQGSMEVFIS